MNFDSEKEGSKLKLSKYFDFEKTLEEKTASSSDSDSMQIYKYNDGSQFQQFLIHMPLEEIEFDFSESFKDMDFSKQMENLKIEKSFSVPAIENSERREPVDLKNVQETLNAGVKFGGDTGDSVSVTFPTLSDGSGSEMGFSSVEYSSGTFVIEGFSNPLTG